MTKKNPWAICTASVGRKDKKKYERCVKGVKKESGMKENILKAAFQKHIADPLKKKKQEFMTGFQQGYYTQTASGEKRLKQKLKKLRQERPRKLQKKRNLPENPRAKTRDQIKADLQARLRGDKENSSTDIVKGARMALAEAVLKKAPSFRDKVRKRILKGDSRTAAVSKEALAQKDKKVKAAQGKNTMSSTFGQKGTQTSTTAYGGSGGSEEDRTPPMSRKQINRSGSSTAKKATPKQTRAANMKLMKDMGALKFDDKGRRVKN